MNWTSNSRSEQLELLRELSRLFAPDSCGSHRNGARCQGQVITLEKQSDQPMELILETELSDHSTARRASKAFAGSLIGTFKTAVQQLRGVQSDRDGEIYSLVILSSPPMYGRNTEGISTDPSGCW